MFNALYSKVYRLLRQRAGLTQEELGDELGISRYTVGKVEAGVARLKPEQEARLLELARCSKEESGELLCQALSEYLQKSVGIDDNHDAYEPATALAMAFALLHERGTGLSSSMKLTLERRIRTTKLLGVTCDQNNADLLGLVQDYREALAANDKEKGDDTCQFLTRT